MKYYQPVYIVSDGYRTGHAPSNRIYTSTLRAGRDMRRRIGLDLAKGEYYVGCFVQPLELIEGRGEGLA